jgi:hypothetical protein
MQDPPRPESGTSRSAFLTTRAAESCGEMLKALQKIDARLAHEPSATTRGVRRELERVSQGIETLRNFLQFTINKIFREMPEEFTPAERADFPTLLATLRTRPTANWPTIAECLSKLPDIRSTSWATMPRDRVVLAALAAAGAPRFAIGTLVDSEEAPKLYDLYDLPPSVGANSGLAPIVRAAIDGTVRFGQRFRFAKPSDQLLGHRSAEDDGAEEEEEVEQ